MSVSVFVARRPDVAGSSGADACQQFRSLSAEPHRSHALCLACLLSRPQEPYSVRLLSSAASWGQSFPGILVLRKISLLSENFRLEMQNLWLKNSPKRGNFGAELKFGAPVMSSNGNLQLSVGKSQLPVPPTLLTRAAAAIILSCLCLTGCTAESCSWFSVELAPPVK